jgi:DNA segregation ATPase FtsK/SpoIIIE-like protein
VLVAGKTGSGKSTLLHILITNAALRFSPDELELYLIDFKQGIEFKTYANYQLPHARVVAVESDREFGVSVLQRLDTEIKVRGERFKQFGAQDLAAYRRADPDTPMPRTLLVIDEFQELFTEDDKVSQDAALYLDRLVRQGRAFGIHVFLGSQTLAGAFSVSRSTLSQMAVRIALQCSEADSQLILSEDNSAARLLTRPGEAIYNDSNGMVEGNHPFQIVWLTEEARDHYLNKVRDMVAERNFTPRPQLVFEGNLPADMHNNGPLSRLLEAGRPAQAPVEAVVWLGDAVAIKDPTSIPFRPQSGANLLMVGQNEDAALGVVQTAMISVAAQFPPTARRNQSAGN